MRIVLTHIPRTGGTSVFAALQAQQPQAKAGEFESLAEVALMTDRELNSYELISTYIGSKLFERLDESWTRIILLRDPIARLKSSYWNLRNSPKSISFASSIAKSCGFREYLASREIAVIFQATNIQTWTILGDKSIFFRDQHAHLNEEKICESAVSRLAAYDFIGFTDRLDDLWARLCSHFGWPATLLPKLRANQPLPEVEAASTEDVIYHTALDCELVSQARIYQRATGMVGAERGQG